jgi:hypothetical protein
VIVYEVIGIVKKKLRKIKSERFRSEATLTRGWFERRLGSWLEQSLPGERGFGGRGKGAAFEPLYPPQLYFEKNG